MKAGAGAYGFHQGAGGRSCLPVWKDTAFQSHISDNEELVCVLSALLLSILPSKCLRFGTPEAGTPSECTMVSLGMRHSGL